MLTSIKEFFLMELEGWTAIFKWFSHKLNNHKWNIR